MIFKDDLAAIAFVQANSKDTPKSILDARKYSKELCALVNGECFLEELIEKIEFIESDSKANARKKYSRDIRDFFERLLLPCQNVWSATGGVKNYVNGETKLSEQNLALLLENISDMRDGKSIERYLESQWFDLYHTDPAGVLLMVYETKDEDGDTDIYPTYQCIGSIRTYIPKGQLTECILFEPKDGEAGIQIWKLIDDAKQYTINQKGETFTIDSDPLKTFEHPFGLTPVIINSNITDKYGKRLSPIDKILPIAKKYAKNLSVAEIYEAQQGFPKHWRKKAICGECHGTRKSGDKNCPNCAPNGATVSADVTDIATIAYDPEHPENSIKGADVMGWSSPDLESLKFLFERLDNIEDKTYETLWGTAPVKKIQKTATEIHYDMQPQINKLNKYADVAEWIEWMMVEWMTNVIDLTKDKSNSISLIIYGRRYILEGIDSIQDKYESAKKAGENSVVLDGIFDELLTVKFKNDPEWMRIELKKAKCEPFLHYSPAEINTFFGATETARKIYFQQWWANLLDSDLQSDVNKLQEKFKSDFEIFFTSGIKIITPLPTTAIPTITE